MNILIIGFGSIGQRHLQNLHKNYPDNNFYVLKKSKHNNVLVDCKIVAKDANKFYHSVEFIDDIETVDKFDIAFICNNTNEHMSYALSLAKKGTHIFVEKPLSHNVNGFKELEATVKDKSIIFMVGYQTKFSPVYLKIKELIKNEKISFVNSRWLTYLPNFHPYEDYKNRYAAKKMFDKAPNEEPWYGLEQEFFILNDAIANNLNDQIGNGQITQGQYYCSVGGKNTFLRHIIEKHMVACVDAGLNISGTNAEVAPYQWEYQIGPSTGIEAGDQLWIARYLLEKIAEEEGYYIDLTPKPFKQINGSGCHANFSTKKMREDNGLKIILNTISKLALNHSIDIQDYGIDNNKRMTGLHETSSYDYFIFDINKPVNRGASVRIGHDTVKEGKGYFEDRRPGSNIDPYIVTSRLFSNYLS